MWNLKKIEIRDFFSHVHSVYEFADNVCTLIVGENKDNGGNNGSGKSTIFEAIAVALTNKSLRDLRKENFINRDAENCKIVLWLDNKALNETLVISRQFFRGSKPVKVELTENGEVNSTITSVDEANKRVYELLGVSREDLLRYFIISQDNDYTFFTAGDVEKKEVLNRITSADMINPLLDKLSEEKKNLSSLISNCDITKSVAEGKLQTLQEQRQELIESDNTKEQIEAINGSIAKCKTDYDANNGEIDLVQSKLKRLQEQYDNFKVVDVTELKQKRQELRNKYTEIQEQIEENEKIQRMAKSDLNGVIKCPSCGEEFMQETKLQLSVEDTKNILSQVEGELKMLERQSSDVTKEGKAIRQKIDETELENDKKTQIGVDIRKAKRKLSEYEDANNLLIKRMASYSEEIERLKKQKANDTAVKNIDEKIEACKEEIAKADDVKAQYEKSLEMYNFWHYYMGKAGFQTYLANRSLSVIEGTVNSFLRKFKSDLSVSVNGFKVLKDGSVREKIEIFALNGGMNAEAFLSKSGGERGRINLAGILAIQHLINMSTNGRGLNFLALDESLAYIDAEGTIEVVKTLNDLGITIMMITQNIDNDSKRMISNALAVEKSNGVSRFVS